MLTFEKILEVFQAYLEEDPLYEVVQTSHGYTLIAWESLRNNWYSAEVQETPEGGRDHASSFCFAVCSIFSAPSMSPSIIGR